MGHKYNRNVKWRGDGDGHNNNSKLKMKRRFRAKTERCFTNSKQYSI
jgi:hypothetical protein